LNLPHIHLLLNHWPVIGIFIGVALFIIALATRNYDIKQTSYVLFAVIALLSVPVYLSGNAAAEVLKKQPGWSAPLASAHEGAAMLAFIALELTGILAICGLWPTSKAGKTETHSQPWVSIAVLLSSLATAGLVAVAGNTGGLIRHPEIVEQGAAPSAIARMGEQLLLALRFFVIDYSRWIWPLLETAHFVGLILLLGAIGILGIRTMGFLKQLPIGPLHRLVPLGLIGVLINVITGFLFFIGMPFFYYGNWYFQLKILLIVIAGALLVLFYCTPLFRRLGLADAGEDARPIAKLVGAASIVLWIVIIVIGRYIPLGESV
jgi:hypothetical protein